MPLIAALALPGCAGKELPPYVMPVPTQLTGQVYVGSVQVSVPAGAESQAEKLIQELRLETRKLSGEIKAQGRPVDLVIRVQAFDGAGSIDLALFHAITRLSTVLTLVDPQTGQIIGETESAVSEFRQGGLAGIIGDWFVSEEYVLGGRTLEQLQTRLLKPGRVGVGADVLERQPSAAAAAFSRAGPRQAAAAALAAVGAGGLQPPPSPMPVAAVAAAPLPPSAAPPASAMAASAFAAPSRTPPAAPGAGQGVTPAFAFDDGSGAAKAAAGKTAPAKASPGRKPAGAAVDAYVSKFAQRGEADGFARWLATSGGAFSSGARPQVFAPVGADSTGPYYVGVAAISGEEAQRLCRTVAATGRSCVVRPR